MSRRKQDSSIAQNLAISLSGVERSLDRLFDQETYLKTVSFRPPNDQQPDWFVIVRFSVGGDGMVAFTSGETFWEASKRFADQLSNGTLKLRPDQYA